MLVPDGPAPQSIVIRTVQANGGTHGWRWVRRLRYRARRQSSDIHGAFLDRGREIKHFQKHRGSFLARFEDSAMSAPPLIRVLGPNGPWTLRGGMRVPCGADVTAFEFEAFLDYLVLSLPYVLQWKGVPKIYQGRVPVRGISCYQLLCSTLPGWRPFEGHRLLVSISVDDYRIVAMSLWPEKQPKDKTTVYLSNHKMTSDGTMGHNWRYPRRWEILRPSGATTIVRLDALEINPRFDPRIFSPPPPGKQAGFAHTVEADKEPTPNDRIPAMAPRKTMFVRGEAEGYYRRRSNEQRSR